MPYLLSVCSVYIDESDKFRVTDLSDLDPNYQTKSVDVADNPCESQVQLWKKAWVYKNRVKDKKN